MVAQIADTPLSDNNKNCAVTLRTTVEMRRFAHYSLCVHHATTACVQAAVLIEKRKYINNDSHLNLVMLII